MSPSRTRRNAGSATIVMLVLLSILLIFVLANLKTLGFLKRELNLVERSQTQRLQAEARDRSPAPPSPAAAQTNSAPGQ